MNPINVFTLKLVPMVSLRLWPRQALINAQAAEGSSLGVAPVQGPRLARLLFTYLNLLLEKKKLDCYWPIRNIKEIKQLIG